MSWALYYDGGCNLCHASKLRAEDWAAQRGVALRVEVLQSPEAIQKGYGGTMALEADGKVYMGADAWLRLMRIAPWYLRWIGILGRLPVLRKAFAFGYWVVARLRHRLFGRRVCPLPGPSGDTPPR